MRRNRIDEIRMFLAVSALSLAASCQVDFSEFDNMQDSGTQEVGIYAGGAGTRTEMLSNGLSAAWTAGDELALWARTSSGSYALSNQVFKTYGIDSERGYFTSTLSSAMADGTYTYMCCYPAPMSVSGTQVTFDLPEVQDGKASGGTDIMIATPVEHGPLAPVPDPDDHSGMSLRMNRMMHQFRFYIPSDNTALGTEKIEKLVLTFPSDVVGDVTLDISDPTAASTLSDGKQQLTLKLAEPISVSEPDEYDYAYAVINPTVFDSGQMMDVKAYTSTMVAEVDPIDLCGRSFQAGHSTPVKLKVKRIVEFPYVLNFNVIANKLGEGLISVKFDVPDDCIWPDGSTGDFIYCPGNVIDAGENIAFRFESKEAYESFSGKEVVLYYESEHAIVSQTINLGEVIAEDDADETVIEVTVPYLFEEDFSSMSVYDGGYNGGVETSVEGASEPAEDLSAYGLPAGWSGARTGCDVAGTSMIIGSRVDYVLLGGTRSYARLESPAMEALKPGASADLIISFDYGGGRSGSSKFYPVAVCGCTYQDGLLDGYATQFNNDASWSGISDYVSIPDIPTSGNSSSLGLKMTYSLTDCTDTCRLSWHVVGLGTAGIANGNQFLYIDNIKVQIAN